MGVLLRSKMEVLVERLKKAVAAEKLFLDLLRTRDLVRKETPLGHDVLESWISVSPLQKLTTSLWSLKA